MKEKVEIKTNELTKNLLSRQDYLVTQGNDLAKAFGNLKAFEHKLLDFCFSYVTRDSKLDDTFKAQASDVLKHFGLTDSGTNYTRVIKGFKTLNEETPLYFLVKDEDGSDSVLMTQLFNFIRISKNKTITFKFSEHVAPYVFDLREKYYSFHLSELSRIKSKYTLILMKMYQAQKMGNQKTVTITGEMNDWQDWFLGVDRSSNWTAGRFKQKVLNVAIDELIETLNVTIVLNTIKKGVKVTGYEITINSD